MDQSTKDKTLDNLTKAQSILIAVSDETGFDGLAAGLALYLSLIKLGKNVSIVARDPSVGDAKQIYGVNYIGKTADKKTPIVVIQNAINTVDKVTYFLDEDKLKVLIHPLPGSTGITKEQISLEYSFTPANLIFAIGFENLEELQSKITHEQQISPEVWIISINVGELERKFAQDSFVDLQATSISEVTAKVLQELALPLDEDIAFNLYTAISHSTQNFSPARTKPQSFEIAAWLIKFGAGRASLAQKETKMPDQHISQPAAFNQKQIQTAQDFFESVPAIEEVESEPELKPSKDWLKPPKIYKGSKSFNGENKG